MQMTLHNDSLEERQKEQSSQIAELQKECQVFYREQFNDIKYCLEQAIKLKDEKRASQKYIERLKENLEFFSSPNKSEEREKFINEKTGGVLSALREDFPKLKDIDYQLIEYMILGFDATLICMITGLSTNNYYTRKSRLKEKILETDSPNAALYKQWIF